MELCNRVLPAALALLLWCGAAVRADVLFDTLHDPQVGGPTGGAYYVHNFPQTATFAGDDLREAVPFTIPAGPGYTLDAIILNVAARFSAAERLVVSLVLPGATGLPGTPIDAWTLTNLPVRPDVNPPQSWPLTTVQTLTRLLLLPGKYWIVLSSPDSGNFTDVYWYANDDLKGPSAMMSAPLNGTGWLTATSAPMPEVRVVATPVPEPCAVAALAIALALATSRRRRA